MADSRNGTGAPFHELPLVLFTALATAGAGLGTAALTQAALAGDLPHFSGLDRLLLVGFLCLGGLISTGHLGRPRKAALALRGLGRSPLSLEVLLLGVTVALGILGVLTPEGSPSRRILDLLAGLGSVGLLLAVGAVYHLAARPSWRGPVFFQPLLMGTAWGLMMSGMSYAGGPGREPAQLLILAVLLGDAILGASHRLRLDRTRLQGEPAHPSAFRMRGWILGGRLLLSAVATPGLLLVQMPGLALAIYTAALLLDRLGFYLLAVRHTTESEVARMEALIL